MSTLINTKLGEHRGKRRIWLEGHKLAREGYEPGVKYDLAVEQAKLVLRPSEEGKYIVSRRKRNGRLIPIIDISRQELAEIFEGVDTLRVMISRGKIVVTAHHQQQKVVQRVERLLSRIKSGEPLRVASLFHGGGVADKACHAGFDLSGVSTKIGVAVEMDGTYLDSSLQNNKEIWDAKSIPIESAIELVNLGHEPPQMDCLIAGIPCSGASLSGRAKGKLKFAEEHDAAGAMFFSFLEFVKALNPAVVIGENVPTYADTASMAVIRSVLGSLGYDVQERVLNGNEFGALENRNRLCFVAISRGLEGVFDLEDVKPLRPKPKQVSDILEPFEDIDESRWKTFSYLADKAKRDKDSGKGFRRQVLQGDEGHCGTIGRGYSKARSTEPFLAHPHDSSLSRLFTPLEHARLKQVPSSVVEGLPDTRAHEVLGQGVCFGPFEALGSELGRALRKAAEGRYGVRLVTVPLRHVSSRGYEDAHGQKYLGEEDYSYANAVINLETGVLTHFWSSDYTFALDAGLRGQLVIECNSYNSEFSARLLDVEGLDEDSPHRLRLNPKSLSLLGDSTMPSHEPAASAVAA
jgi:DNA (cytosine-5)-methyltransferase 1